MISTAKFLVFIRNLLKFSGKFNRKKIRAAKNGKNTEFNIQHVNTKK
jgi:hypothetical protein